MNKTKPRIIEHGGHIYIIAPSDTNRLKQFFNDIHCWLIKKLVGKKPIIMNVEFTNEQVQAGDNLFLYGCTFYRASPAEISAMVVGSKYGRRKD